MNKPLAFVLVLLASAASAATPLEKAAAIAEQLGMTAAPAAAAIAAPAMRPASAAAASSPAVKIAVLAGASGSISGYASATGSGSMMCSGGMMSGWINLTANVSVTTDDGATAQFPVNGTAYLSGSCANGSGGFVSGSAYMNGSGALYKAGRYVGNASLSGNAFVNQYVNGPFAWITQSVYLSGSYNESAALASK
jgi:hypothetical protein